MQTRFPSGPPGRGTTTLHAAGSSTNFREYQALPVQPRFPSLTSEDRGRVGVRVALTWNKLRDPPAEHQIACFRNRCTAHDARTPPSARGQAPGTAATIAKPLGPWLISSAGGGCVSSRGLRAAVGPPHSPATPTRANGGDKPNPSVDEEGRAFRALAPARWTRYRPREGDHHKRTHRPGPSIEFSGQHCTNRCPRAPPARPLTCPRPLDLPAFTAPAGVCQVEGSNREKWGARLNQLSAARLPPTGRRHVRSLRDRGGT